MLGSAGKKRGTKVGVQAKGGRWRSDFTDLKLGATLVHVIGTANSRLGPFYSKVSLMVIKRRGLLSPMWQGMPATTLYFVDCER